MSSTIDPSKPTQIQAYTAHVRSNFAAAKAEIEALQGQVDEFAGAGPYIPTSGGEMEGPLLYTATGGTASRSAQDRATDTVNVLELEADPTGVTDSTIAFQRAFALGRRVRIPYGNYKITDAITISAGQKIEGDGARTTCLNIPTNANLSAAGLPFVLGPGTREADVEIRDLWIRFAQPDFVGMTRADIIRYPPAINTTAGNRAKFINLCITNAWIGIDYDGGGAGFLDRVEMSAYSVGLRFGQTKAVLDGTHVSNYHFWNFAQTTNQLAVMWDGVTIGAQLGRIDGLFASDWLIFRANLNITATAGVGGFYYMSNIAMDSTTCTLTISDALRFEGVNWHFTKGGFESPAVVITGGRSSFHNLVISSSMTATVPVQISGGSLAIVGGSTWFKETVGVEFVSVTGGLLDIDGITFATHFTPHTTPCIHQSGTGIALVRNCHFVSGIVGVALQIDVDNATNAVVGNMFNGWTFTPPGPLGFYGLNSNMISPRIGQFGALLCQTLGSTATNLTLRASAGQQRSINVQTGGALRWAWILGDNTAETGGNSGSDFELSRYDDAGIIIDQPLSVDRSTGFAFIRNLHCNGFALNLSTPVGRQDVAGAWAGNTAGKALCVALAKFGLITDNTTP